MNEQKAPARRLNVLHAIHDFLPRHLAGSEIYTFELCRELAGRHHVSVLTAEYDPGRPHGHVTWRVQSGLPVIEVVNNWRCATFAETYRPAFIGAQLDAVLQAVQPDVLHVHNLLNLSFDLPALAHARGIPVVATVHDYTLVCPSGGQRIHRADAHVCHVIDPDRCARCFRESPFAGQMAFTRIAGGIRASRLARNLAMGLLRRAPALAGRLAGAVQQTAAAPVTAGDIRRRLDAARTVFAGVDLVVTPSQSMADEFLTLGMPAKNVRVSDNGFAPLRSSPDGGAGRSRATGGPLRIGFVGTIAWHKGVHVLVDAVGRLPANRFVLKIFGDTNVFPEYAAALRTRAAGLPVEFMGAFDRDRTGDVYAQIDVLVVPSIWLENSPLVIHEAFMAGVPVVGARMGGIAELVADGVNGLLYQADSAASLEAVLRRIIDDPSCLEVFARSVPPVKSIAQDARDWETRYRDVLARAGRERRA